MLEDGDPPQPRQAMFPSTRPTFISVHPEVYQLPQSWSCSSDLSELLARRSHPTVAVPALPAWDWRPENLVPSRKPTEEWPLELWTMPLMKVPQMLGVLTAFGGHFALTGLVVISRLFSGCVTVT